MIQAKSGSGRFTSQGSCPSPGERLRDFQLAAAGGRQVRFSDYRGRRNVVLVLTGDCRGALGPDFLSALAARYPGLVEEEAEVLAVIAAGEAQAHERIGQISFPFPLLMDPTLGLHRSVCAVEKNGTASTAIYLTDRFGEVVAAFRTPDGDALPQTDEILKWLQFINMQCPECFPPEWPAA